MSDERHDAIVVGSGCTGGWAAKELAEGGRRVLVLEAGAAVAAGSLDAETWSPELRFGGGIQRLRARQPIQSQYAFFQRANHHLFIDDVDNPYTHPDDAPFHWIRSRQVGGRSLLWGGTALRLSDFELKAGSRDGLSPDWPLAHADLAPHYAKVERALGVRGARDGLDELPDGEFLPPSPMTDAEARLRAHAEARGDRRLIHARGIPVRTATGWRGAGAGWPPFTSQGSTLAAAEATGRVSLRTDAVARRVLLAADGKRATGVEIVDRSGAITSLHAELVLLCASTIESVRILLHSACDAAPRGLGNSSGLLGRGLMDHPIVLVSGHLPSVRESEGVDERGGPNGIYVPRFRNLRAPHAGFARGYGILGRAQRGARSPDGQATFLLCAICEMLPRLENRVTLDPVVRDAWGIPAARVECRFAENEHAMLADAEAQLVDMVDALDGRIDTTWRTLPGQGIHEVGGAPMGTDPQRSVVDPAGRLWDVPNVLVLDGASWPTSAYQNPTLTMMALAVRACTEALR